MADIFLDDTDAHQASQGMPFVRRAISYKPHFSSLNLISHSNANGVQSSNFRIDSIWHQKLIRFFHREIIDRAILIL